MFRSEIGSGFEDPGGTPPPRIPRSIPPPGAQLAGLPTFQKAGGSSVKLGELSFSCKQFERFGGGGGGEHEKLARQV